MGADYDGIHGPAAVSEQVLYARMIDIEQTSLIL
jgi:hypothetical protein